MLNTISAGVILRPTSTLFGFLSGMFASKIFIITYITNIINMGFMALKKDHVNNMLITLLITHIIYM